MDSGGAVSADHRIEEILIRLPHSYVTYDGFHAITAIQLLIRLSE